MRSICFAICLLLVATSIVAAADTTVQAWRAPDGAVLWRGASDGNRLWELFDADADGKPEVAVFFAGGKTTRIEIDSDRDGAADRVYLFFPDGHSEGFLDADGDGVLETPAGSPAKRMAALHEIGRSGSLFKKATEMRFAADAGELAPIDLPAPPVSPPMQREPGKKVKFVLRLSVIPAKPPIMMQRTESLDYIGEIEVNAPAAAGTFDRRLKVSIRTDPTERKPDVPGELAISCYPVYVQDAPVGDQPGERHLLLQIGGQVRREGLGDDIFFVTMRVEEMPAFAQTPIFDRVGRMAGQLLLEINRP